ncbi:hypothetical protein [Nonomuraea sp. B5E05]|uniref:hypothetical protein n=1 Tax=Nonomuraea sp. B5E05 TaxID=3153569 RepID=UPI0032617241
MPVVYELCMAGGLCFIRKITRVGVNVKVEEFTTRPNSRVHDLWNSLFDLPKKQVRVDNSRPQPGAEQRPTDDEDGLAKMTGLLGLQRGFRNILQPMSRAVARAPGPAEPGVRPIGLLLGHTLVLALAGRSDLT